MDDREVQHIDRLHDEPWHMRRGEELVGLPHVHERGHLAVDPGQIEAIGLLFDQMLLGREVSRAVGFEDTCDEGDKG